MEPGAECSNPTLVNTRDNNNTPNPGIDCLERVLKAYIETFHDRFLPFCDTGCLPGANPMTPPRNTHCDCNTST